MKILFISLQYIHAARWINQLKDAGHDIYVFDCLDKPIHKDLEWTNAITNWSKRKLPYVRLETIIEKKSPLIYDKVIPFLKVTASEKISEIIKDIQPDLVHSLEMQSQTYNVLKAKLKYNFKWAYFSWGSDLYHYQKDNYQKKKIKNVLANLDYFFADNSRDYNIAANLNFKGKKMPVFPGGGGYNIKELNQYKKPFKERNLILVKGYDHWAGKSLKVLEAFRLIINQIRDFDIYFYSAHKHVSDKIDEFNKEFNLNINYSHRHNELPQEELFKKFGKAKIAIGNNITDGIPNTLLEAIILGAFPIQSNPGGVTEDYILDGENGLLINNPLNNVEIADKILFAINNEEMLVDAFKMNALKANNLEYNSIKEKVLKVYNDIEIEIKKEKQLNE